MTDYSEVDGVIDHWVRATGSTLCSEWAGKSARFFYLPGEPPFECFQISIDPPETGRLAVLARSIDTNDDSEMEQTWEGPIENLDTMLRSAIAAIEVWKTRDKMRHD